MEVIVLIDWFVFYSRSIRCFQYCFNARLVNGFKITCFSVPNYVKRDCVLAPTHLSLIFRMMLLSAFKETDPGMRITNVTDKSIINTQRMKKKREKFPVTLRMSSHMLIIVYGDRRAKATLQRYSEAIPTENKQW